MKKLWKFDGSESALYAFIGGLFVATDEEVKNLIGKDIYFGEVEGKYSDVVWTIEENEISLVSDNPVVINAIGDFGINPLEKYLEQEEERNE